MFRFANPVFLLLLPLAWGVLWARLRWWRPTRGGLRFSDARLLDGLPLTWRVRWRWMPNALRLLAWCLMVVVVARPQLGDARSVVRGRGLDIVMALDISSSMRGLDFAPQTRLDAAKTVISEFVAGRTFDRVGLVLFARDAYHYVPPTLDYALLDQLLEDVRVIDEYPVPFGSDGTAVGMGLASAANMLRASDAPSRVIVLLTDGRDNEPTIAPLTAARAVAALGFRVYTVGMGRTGLVPAPVGDTGITQLVPSDLDESTLQMIADLTGGAYFRAEDYDALQRVYAQIDALERADVERQVLVRWADVGPPWLVLVLVLLLAERTLRLFVFTGVA